MPYTAYIVDACRTAGGKKNGALSGWHPADLGAAVCDGIISRNKIDANHVDDIIFGCVCQNGSQAGNIGRNVVLASQTLPQHVPGVSVDRQCGSSQQALHFAAQAVMSGTQDVVIAGGVEVMSLVPIGSNVADSFKKGRGLPMSEGMTEKYGEDLEKSLVPYGMSPAWFSQFGGAELLAKKYGLTKEDTDKFAVLSQHRAAAATKEGRFSKEVLPVEAKVKELKEGQKAPEGNHIKDEGIRAGVNYDAISKLKPMYKGGIITPASSSQIADGASAVLICNEAGLAKLGVKPRAKIVGLSVAASDPVVMLEGPVFATQNALKKMNMDIKQIDLYEVNEAFAPVPLAWAKAIGADMEKLNVNGGAMALGHPLGGTGTKLIATLLAELERRGGRYGLLSICEGGGTANATIIERVTEATPSKL